MAGDMFYSEHLAIQEKYALKQREFLPPFSIILAIAFSVHLLIIIVWSFLPHPAGDAVPFRALHLKFGSPNGTVSAAPAGSAATISALDAALAAPKPAIPAAPKSPASPKALAMDKSTPPRIVSRPALAAIAPAAGKDSAMAGMHSFAGLPKAGKGAGTALPYGSPLGTDATGGDETVRRYEQMISGWIEQHKIYPLEAQQQGVEGRVLLRIRINRSGQIQYVRVEQSSGSDLLDRAVIETARASNPVPAVPVDYPGGNLLEFRVPIEFHLVR